MEKVLIDSDILIYIGNNDRSIIELVKKLEERNQLSISIITEMEMLVGCRNKQEFQKLDKFLRRFNVVALNEYISEIAKDLVKKYYLSHGLEIPDALIASTAIHWKIPLLTKNKKDFKFIQNLELIEF
ncbi:MAG: type II toxin-antitoxin system VapC family toxin [Leptospiraceae bacterium]|nr:type II toxin-antitoxin system VapC family toxin [Leptospiraceae bacterium]MCP5498197.1 type II toxin-antitoxin system VapC family toxin [Leptospiraceae bacterium]